MHSTHCLHIAVMFVEAAQANGSIKHFFRSHDAKLCRGEVAMSYFAITDTIRYPHRDLFAAFGIRFMMTISPARAENRLN